MYFWVKLQELRELAIISGPLAINSCLKHGQGNTGGRGRDVYMYELDIYHLSIIQCCGV